MRRRWAVGAVVLLLVAAWFVVTREEPEPRRAREAPSRPTQAPSAAEVFESSTSLDVPEPVAEPRLVLDVGELAPGCRPSLVRGEGPPLELTFTGTDLPAKPPPMRLEVRWPGLGESRRWFVEVKEWKTTLWLCDASDVSIGRGPLRLKSTSVPRSGAVTLVVERAPAPGVLTVRTLRRGVPVAGVSVNVTGCEPLTTDDAGVAVTNCEELDEPRFAVVRAPWRSTARALIEPNAVEVTLLVLGRDEVEPGRIGLVFGRASIPTAASLLRDSPAERAGVLEGDEVLEVDGRGVSTVEEARVLLQGAPGTPVRLKLRRGVDVVLVDVVRAAQGLDTNPEPK